MSATGDVLVEVCVDDAAGAAIADRAGADRIELCSALIVGGLTPSIGTVQATLEAVQRVGVQVLIRPRPGDFVFDAIEMRTMVADIEAVVGLVRSFPVPVGFVIGALTADCEVDRAATSELVAACRGLPVTFHRAFDLTPNLDRSLDVLVDLGVQRVLTGGGMPRAVDGREELARLVHRGGNTISVMPGGSVRPANVRRIVEATGAHEVHLRAARSEPNHLSPRYPGLRMASAHAVDEERRDVTSADIVTAVLRALDRA